MRPDENTVTSSETGNSDAGTTPEATTRVASGADAPPEQAAGHRGPGPHGLGTADSTEVDSDDYVPSGDPEAPTGPVGHGHAHPADDGSEGAQDLAKLTAKAEKADQYLQLAQRTQADFENYRKRAAREAAASQDRGVARLAKELLPAIDNLDRALAAAETGAPGGDAADNGDSPLASGIKLVHADVLAALARVGIERFSPEGEPFDPQHHEAVAQVPVEGAASGTVVEVYQRGYRLGESVLRPARVVVAQ
jgi:molecular chaperone GrpE